MTRLPTILLLGLAGASVVGADQQSPRFRSGTNTVSVYATVVDEAGRLVPNLTRDDFEVFDNGQRQSLSVFENAPQPIAIVMMLDRSGSMTRNFSLVRDAADAFIGKLAPGDRARVGSFSSHVLIGPPEFTSDHERLRRVLRDELQDPGPTPLWKATDDAMTALGRQDGRRVVLLFTDGQDSPLDPAMAVKFADVRLRAQAEEVMVYAIGLSDRCGASPAPASETPLVLFQRAPPGRGGGSARPVPRRPGGRIVPGRPGGLVPGRPGGLGPTGSGGIGGGRVVPPPPPDVPVRGGNSKPIESSGCQPTTPDPDLRTLAADGGGGYFELRATDHLGKTFARVADELHHQYLLAFPAPVLDGTLHSIEVRVRHANYTVRARKGYLAGK